MTSNAAEQTGCSEPGDHTALPVRASLARRRRTDRWEPNRAAPPSLFSLTMRDSQADHRHACTLLEEQTSCLLPASRERRSASRHRSCR